MSQPEIRTANLTGMHHKPTAEDMMREFLSVFDGQVRKIEGEKFSILMTE